MGDNRIFAGGEFLITDVTPEEVFTPEDFTAHYAVQSLDSVVGKVVLKVTQCLSLRNQRCDFFNYPVFPIFG